MSSNVMLQSAYASTNAERRTSPSFHPSTNPNSQRKSQALSPKGRTPSNGITMMAAIGGQRLSKPTKTKTDAKKPKKMTSKNLLVGTDFSSKKPTECFDKMLNYPQ
jgi:hypothetical protein